MKKQIKAVIFDLDGTLIDTEKYYVNYGYEVLKEMGYHPKKEAVLTLRSLDAHFAEARMKTWFGEAFDFLEFRRKRREKVVAAIEKNGIEKKPYAGELLDELKKRGIASAVATATDEKRAGSYLEQIGLRDRVDYLVSVSNVARGKPMPDVYLEVCRRLGEAADECMAVEDSPNGVQSAYEAGLSVIMVPDLTQPEEKLRRMLCGVADNLWEILQFL